MIRISSYHITGYTGEVDEVIEVMSYQARGRYIAECMEIPMIAPTKLILDMMIALMIKVLFLQAGHRVRVVRIEQRTVKVG